MSKRILAFVMSLFMMLHTSILSVYAAEGTQETTTLEECIVCVQMPDEAIKCTVYKNGKELLFSSADLARMTYYDYELDEYKDGDDIVYFSRNAKEIEIYMNTEEVWVGLDDTWVEALTFETTPVKIKSEWYLPASEILPWMNVFCFADGGELYVLPDEVSYFDIIEDFDMDEFAFSFTENCEAIGVNNKSLAVTAFFERQGISGTIYHALGDDVFDSYGSRRTFYDVFELFLEDRTSSSHAVEIMETEGAIYEYSLKFWEAISKENNLSREMKFFSTASESFKMIDLGVECARYYNIYNQDNTVKLGIMDKIRSKAYSEIYSSNATDSADEIYKAYTDYWYGIFRTTSDKITDTLTDELVGKAVEVATGTTLLMLTLDAVDLATNLTISWDEAIDNIRVYRCLAPSAQKYFEIGYEEDDYCFSSMEGRIGNAILFLYCQKQCYLAMNQYMDATCHYDAEQYEENEEMAALADEWIGKFLAVYEARRNDSTSMNTYGEDGIVRDACNDYLKDEFDDLDLNKPASDNISNIEYAFLLATLEETLEETEYQWLLRDIDQDGENELVVELNTQTAGYPAQFLCDAGSGSCLYYCNTSGSGASRYLGSANDGNIVYLSDGCNTIPERASSYYVWNGSGWELFAEYHLTESASGPYAIEAGGYITNYDGNVTWDGKEISQDEFYNREAETFESLSYDCTDLSDFTIKGDTKKLLSEIETYFKARMGYHTSTRADLNQDNKEDLLIAMFDAAYYWFGHMEGAEKCSEEFAAYETNDLTLLAAEAVQNGVRIRFVNVLPEGVRTTSIEGQYELSETMLTIGSTVYHYQEAGDVYVAETAKQEEMMSDDVPSEALTLMELSMMSEADVSQYTDNYVQEDGNTATCQLSGTTVTVRYDENRHVTSVYAENDGGFAQIVGAFPLNSKFADLWYAIPAAVSDWSIPVLTQMGYTTEFILQDAATGIERRCQLTTTGTEPEAEVVCIWIGDA